MRRSVDKVKIGLLARSVHTWDRNNQLVRKKLVSFGSCEPVAQVHKLHKLTSSQDDEYIFIKRFYVQSKINIYKKNMN